MKMLFFINPNAGKSGIRLHMLEVLKLFCAAGWEVRTHVTAGPKEITKILLAEGEQYDMVVASGGDGTLNETVAGLLRLEKPPVLGYIPAGTTNDVAATLHLPMDPVEAAKVILEGIAIPLDAGVVNGRPFAYVAAFGAFTDVTYSTTQGAKKALGRLAYLLRGVTTLGEIKPIHARVIADGVEDEDDFLLGLICNTRSVGGFRPAMMEDPAISLNDGLSEVIFVRNIRKLADLGEAATQVLKMDITNQKRFLNFQTSRVRVEFDQDVAWTVDGEDGGTCRVAELENRYRALHIMVPRPE